MAYSVGRKALGNCKRDALRFAEADINCDGRLTFEEFLSMQPPTLREEHTHDEMREWFSLADTDGNGTISLNEWFSWSLSKETTRTSHDAQGSISAIFQLYDKDGSGARSVARAARHAQLTPRAARVALRRGVAWYGAVRHTPALGALCRRARVHVLRRSGFLDPVEFHRACNDMGFGSLAVSIFNELDDDASGYIRYSELVNKLTDASSQECSAYPCRGSNASPTRPDAELVK